MVCAVDVLIVVAILGDFTLCLRFAFVLVFASALLWRGYHMGKWSQYRARYQVEWEQEDSFRGECLLRCSVLGNSIVDDRILGLTAVLTARIAILNKAGVFRLRSAA